MKKLLIFIISFLIILSSVSVIALAEEETPKVKTANGYYDIDAPEYESEICLLVNSDTDTVIYSKNADMITAPASLAKIVTALVVLSKGDSLDTQITCSKAAIDSLLGTGSSFAGLLADEIVSLEMLLYCLFLPSANDAAIVLAEHYGNGDVQAFVDEM
ncbi:MAG: D-alanyl-D-alanine carboxypeptidase, partial [Clostridia bacterium]|nr:D-alanyl-D-alanine carboxypeptidase [Clostridia bacterium]